jgi:hypothetical protein
MNLPSRVALIGLQRTLKVMGIATAVLAAAEGVQWAICFVDARREGL